MQIKYLHPNIYKLYAWARTQEYLDVYRRKHEDVVRQWQSLKAEGVSDLKCAQFMGISRATDYRVQKSIGQACMRDYIAAP